MSMIKCTTALAGALVVMAGLTAGAEAKPHFGFKGHHHHHHHGYGWGVPAAGLVGGLALGAVAASAYDYDCRRVLRWERDWRTGAYYPVKVRICG